jgi:hypothetical protein
MTQVEGRSAREGTRPGRLHLRAEHTLDILAKGLAGEGPLARAGAEDGRWRFGGGCISCVCPWGC